VARSRWGCRAREAVQAYGLVQDATPELVGASAATRLFVERAASARPGFAVTAQNAPAIVDICARLDGIPLAIELAAARVNVLSVEQVAARLDDRFRLLTGGRRLAMARQQTLRAALDWSFDLLGEPERTLFRRLAVFAGGATLDLVEAVCPDGALPADAVLDLLAELVDKSLVLAETEGPEVRYRLLETMRQYGEEKLRAAGEAERVRAQHRDALLALAERGEREVQGPAQATWVDRLDREHDNLRAALEWCRAAPDGREAGLRLAGALWRFWWVCGYLSEGRRWLDDALTGSEAAAPEARVKALNGAGNLAYAQGDYGRATALHEEALALRRALGDQRGLAASLNNLAALAQAQGDFARAAALHAEGLALRRALGDQQGIAASLNNLATVAQQRGDYAQAVALHEESLALRRQLGDERGIAFSLSNLGIVAQDLGEYEHATALLDEALTLFRKLHDQPNIAASLDQLGTGAQRQGDLERAAALHAESLALRRALGDRRGTAAALSNLACVALERADAARACALYGESLHLFHEVSDRPAVASCLEGLARVAAATGQRECAGQLCGAAEALREAIGAPLLPTERAVYDRQVAALCAEWGDQPFATAWARGWSMPLETAIAAAVGLAAPR
jgi:predicted ATPase